VQLVAVQVGRIILVTFVQVIVKLDESIKFLPVCNFLNLY